MTAKRQSAEKFEEREGSGRVGRILAAVALYGAMLLLGYIVLATPEAGTAMVAIQNVLRGLGGTLAIVIPLIFGWLATLLVLAAAGRKISVWRSAVDGVLFVCLFTAVQLAVTEDVIRNRMTILTFANYVNKSYSYGAGGGGIGALLAWPLYQSLGVVGGVLATILLALLALTATGRLQRLVRWAGNRAEDIQHDTEQRRMVRENEHMFEIDGEQPRRRRAMDPASDELHLPDRSRPESESLLDDAPFVKRLVRDDGPSMAAFDGSHRRSRGRIQPDVPESVKKRRRPMAAEASEADEAPRRRGANAPDSHAAKPGDSASNPSARPGEGASIPPRRPVRTADEAANAPADATAHPADAPASARRAPKSPRGDSAAGGSPDRSAQAAEEAESIRRANSAEARPRRSQPEKPAFDAESVRGVKAEEHQIAMDDDLTIEPETCDVLENDDPPFDMPVKKPMKKLRRPTAPAAEDEDPYNYPPIDLLEAGENIQENHRDSDMEKAGLLEDTLKQFGIATRLTGIAHGPAVTRFELQPAPGVKVSRITSLSDDIAMHLAAMSVRIEAPIPGKAAVGVEIPNDKVEMVRLRDVLESPEARKSVSKIAVGLGKDNSGRYIVADIAKMPHVLIAGQTGSGKSVCINSIITSILFRATPDEVRLILIDPKMVELSIYNDIPHLVCPVVTDCKKAASALDWAVAEMSMRYKRFAERGVRDIKGYNKALIEGEKPMPQMVIIIDELADLMMVAPGEVEDSICRLAQLARAAGMHLVIATQRPSVNVVTGIIKANIPTRIAFCVASQVDSRTMIDHGGAEKLLGNGDMLFVPSGINKPMRVQGAWVSDEEVHAIVEYIKERSETSYDVDMIEKMDNAARTDAEKEEVASEYDPRLPEAVEIVVEAGQASVSMLQRRMRVGYARAGRLIDEMEQRGIVSEADGAKPRSVLITREEMNDLFTDE